MTSEANTRFYSEAVTSADGEQIRAAFTPVERGWLIELQANGMVLKAEYEWANSRSDAIIVGRQMVCDYTARVDAEKAARQLEDAPKPAKKKHGTFQVSKAFYETIDAYKQAQGLKSWSQAITRLAAIGYNRETGKEAPAPSEPWGGPRRMKDERLE